VFTNEAREIINEFNVKGDLVDIGKVVAEYKGKINLGKYLRGFIRARNLISWFLREGKGIILGKIGLRNILN
jgi:hypothetical protein